MNLTKFTDNIFSSNTKMTNLLPIVKYDDGCFILKDGTNFDLVEINCKDLSSITDEDLEYDILRLTKFLRIYNGDLKIVAMNFPVSTHQQIQYFKHKSENSTNERYRHWLNKEINTLENIEQNQTQRSFYMMFFSKDVDEHNRNLATITNVLDRSLVSPINAEQKKQIIFKMTNKSTALYGGLVNNSEASNLYGKYEKLIQRGQTQEDIIAKEGYDPFLLSQIQPQGGISFKDEKIIKTGDGYEMCINIYQYPPQLRNHWLANLMNIDGAVTTVDLSTINSNIVNKNINRGLQEQNARYVSAGSPIDRINAQMRYQELEQLNEEVSSMGEIIKSMTVRIFVAEKSQQEAERRATTVIDFVESNNYKGAVFLNEGKNEWISMFTSATAQQETIYKRYGQSIQSLAFAAGDPYNYSSLNDPFGGYVGNTTMTNGGSVLFDMFHKNKARTSYSAVVVGKTGAGKSTFLKKLLIDRAIRDDYIRGFDVSGEFRELVYHFGGKYISLDGSDGVLNVFDVLKTSEDEQTSFTQHISKLIIIFEFLAPEADWKDKLELSNLLRTFYIYHGLIPKEGITSETQITGLNPKVYPTFSDFLEFINVVINKLLEQKETVKKELIINRLERVENIRLIVDSIVSKNSGVGKSKDGENKGGIFDGHTTIENISNEKIVFFNIKNLKDMGDNIFNAQMYNAISLCWDNNTRIGAEMKHLNEIGEIDDVDITHFITFVDESHRIVNANKVTAVEQFNIILREARKHFGGLIFASQSYLDFVPEGANADGISQMKTLFSLTQYKFLMKQDSADVAGLRNVFGEGIRESQLSKIPMFEQGQCLLLIAGDKSVEFKVDVSQSELNLFRGGV